MKKPLIGIVAKPKLEADMWYYTEIVDDIRYKVIQNGGNALGILPTNKTMTFKLDDELDKTILSEEELTDLHDIIDKMYGIILTGGLVSNNYEQEIASYCIKKDIPLIGICAGFNNMIRALGGKTHLDNSGLHKQYGSRIAHNIVINRDSKLYQILKNDNIMVNSIHTYVTTKEEVIGYEIAATCPIDNTIEAIEMPDKKFVMGIKWHPELMDNMNEIFKSFIDNCH
ncbi:MAG: gamma-glutamyl-gamma-aminobutyrate hydrolase family protein [Bacilli bacterium]|nr:gamma-glutamyl-gamma-aminobutyrate hydrolase family protein [Bacilli bacterium]